MREEETLKLRTRATSCMVNFVRGLINEEGDEEIDKENEAILKPYATPIVDTISVLFQQSIELNYGPLQEEVLSLLSCLANGLSSNFVEHYGKFMPGLKQILNTFPMETQSQQQLRCNCIQTIGYILTAVNDKPEVCKVDALEIATTLTQLFVSGKIKSEDP